MEMVIGITGPIGSGKRIVADWLKEKGFSCYSLSDIVREEAARRGLAIERKNLQDTGNELRARHGGGVLAEMMLKRIKGKKAVIESIRNPGEVKALRKAGKSLLVGVDSGQRIRFERIKERARESDPKTWEEFVKIDERDSGEKDESGQQVRKCMQMADIVLANNYKTVEEFRREIGRELKNIIS